MRVFCLPFAGGGASLYHPWRDLLPEAVEVCPVQLPGREGRVDECPIPSVKELVPSLMQGLEPFLDVPFAFFGHSMGALIGFELTRALLQRGLPGPRILYLSGHRAPHLPSRGQPISHLPDAELVQAIRLMHGTPEELLAHPELLQLVLPAVRADFALCEGHEYVDSEPLSSPIVVFGGLDDDTVSHPELLAWKQHTRGAFQIRMLPGDHFFLISYRSLLIRHLAMDLNRLLPTLR
jgi:surfactin synthase thioesterase subunit